MAKKRFSLIPRQSWFGCRTVAERLVVGIFSPDGWRIEELKLPEARVALAHMSACVRKLEAEAAKEASWADFIGTLPRRPLALEAPDDTIN